MILFKAERRFLIFWEVIVLHFRGIRTGIDSGRYGDDFIHTSSWLRLPCVCDVPQLHDSRQWDANTQSRFNLHFRTGRRIPNLPPHG